MRLERWILTISLRLRALFRSEELDRDVDEELAFHIDQRTQEFVSHGIEIKEARRLAFMAMEGVTRRREECRDMRGWSTVESWQQDFRWRFDPSGKGQEPPSLWWRRSHLP